MKNQEYYHPDGLHYFVSKQRSLDMPSVMIWDGRRALCSFQAEAGEAFRMAGIAMREYQKRRV